MAGEIAQWMEQIEFGQYVKAFDDIKIDVDILPDLSDVDLDKQDISRR